MFGYAKEFCPNFAKLTRNFFVRQTFHVEDPRRPKKGLQFIGSQFLEKKVQIQAYFI